MIKTSGHRAAATALVAAAVLAGCQPLTTRPLTGSEIDAFVDVAGETALTASMQASRAAWDQHEVALVAAEKDELEALREDARGWSASAREFLAGVEGRVPEDLVHTLTQALDDLDSAIMRDDAADIVARIVNAETVLSRLEEAGTAAPELPTVTAPNDVVADVPGAQDVVVPRARRQPAARPPRETPAAPAAPATPATPASPAPPPAQPEPAPPPAPAPPPPAPTTPEPGVELDVPVVIPPSDSSPPPTPAPAPEPQPAPSGMAVGEVVVAPREQGRSNDGAPVVP
ncbi:hypothetical protein [Georgenia sp. AZ-5]|uniref:hypothetical protein n=1 Tax=Georgenia sp. AZ-5 TaxID=3367526 RepID=UPI003754D5E7